jgi:hypothetical protein
LHIFIPGIFCLMHLLLVTMIFCAENKVCMALLRWVPIALLLVHFPKRFS